MTPFALIERPLCLAGTAFAFAVFGLGGLLYRFPVAPLLNLDRDAVRRHRRARRIVQWWFAREMQPAARELIDWYLSLFLPGCR